VLHSARPLFFERHHFEEMRHFFLNSLVSQLSCLKNDTFLIYFEMMFFKKVAALSGVHLGLALEYSTRPVLSASDKRSSLPLKIEN
jgi:hypothetical protein